MIGAHVPSAEPLAEAAKVRADCLQMFLGNPQSWRKPKPRADAAALRASELPVYVHAPYLINVASPNNRVRIPSRKILSDTLEGAAEVGAAGVIVHAGHAEDGVERGFVRWRKALDELEPQVPLLIENTAGGDNAMARRIDVLERLWAELEGYEVGFCFDTCHAHAAGEELEDVVERVLQATGRIDVVHANSSRDAPGTGADRHASFAAGKLDPAAVVDMVKAARCDVVICETPWETVADDIAYLRSHL